MSDLDAVQEALGHPFEDLSLLERALTHRSYANEHNTPDYERLEFLGDAVLQMCSTLLLVDAFPTEQEGELSRLRSKLVRTETLATIARELGLGQALRLGRGEAETGGRSRPSNLADATEAVLGAVYRDAGLQPCLDLVEHWMAPRIATLQRPERVKRAWKDPRSRLQELTQSNGGSTPTYKVLERVGPPHSQVFRAAVCVDDAEIGRGEGKSKKTAFAAAAQAALDALEPPKPPAVRALPEATS